jgi:hypothetical protein
MRLSASVLTFAATGFLPGNVRDHPDVFDVAVSTYVVVEVSVPVVGTAFMSHLPATSARLTAAGAGGVVLAAIVLVVLDDMIAVESVTASSFLAHPARTAAQQQIATRVERCRFSM